MVGPSGLGSGSTIVSIKTGWLGGLAYTAFVNSFQYFFK